MPETQRSAWDNFTLPPDLHTLLQRCARVIGVESRETLRGLICGEMNASRFEVSYALPDGSIVTEAEVVRVRNGYVINYPEPYMRRRDPNTMLISDDKPTDKPRFEEVQGARFDRLRAKTMNWLSGQDLLVMAFHAGAEGMGAPGLVIAPVNAAFFVFGLSLLQGMIPFSEIGQDFSPAAIVYVAPPFRHTDFKGRQVVVHHRGDAAHEVFAYNLYPGPSAKKGIYGVLIDLGEAEGWITAHCSAVRVVTPYDNEIVIMHEGASGGGKSEMLEYPHRLSDGRIHMGRNMVTGEERFIEIPRGCQLQPVVDDMAQCHASLQGDDGKITLVDAENAWFVRVNHIQQYGTDLDLEKLTAMPPQPLLFLNIDAAPEGRALIWEHTMDAPGKPCPNPRVILPREIVPGIVNEPVKVDVRSFGVRTPPCSRAAPTYGILGMMHLLPPALAWLWRLVAPRGHANPSVIESEGLTSEGVGSYWPFVTGRRVEQANLLLRQFLNGSRIRCVLIPNQHIGVWEVGFMPNWICREYLARRGMARFKREQIVPARCPLLGYAFSTIQVEGRLIPHWFLEVNTQPEVGDEGYDRGAEILTRFFHDEVRRYLDMSELEPKGREIIEKCLAGASAADYEELIPMYD